MDNSTQKERVISERHIALKLHSLNKKERRKLMKQLPAKEKSIISNLLIELEELGIPKLPVDSINQLPSMSYEESILDELDEKERSDILASLKNEPDVIRKIIITLFNDDDSDLLVNSEKLGVTPAVREYLLSFVREYANNQS